MKILMLGSGVWGQAIGKILSLSGHTVSYWNRSNLNNKEWNKNELNKDFDYVFIAISTQYIRSVLETILEENSILKDSIFVVLSKGIEISGKRISEVLSELGIKKQVFFYGSVHAKHILSNGAFVAASENIKYAEEIKNLFILGNFSISLSRDVVSLEIFAAFKNCVAIAYGILEGLQAFNEKALLFSTASREMIAIANSFGGRQETFFTAAGVGDLFATCMHGRNRAFGEALVKKEEILNDEIVEGVASIKAFNTLFKENQIECLLNSYLYSIIYEQRNPKILLDLFRHTEERE